MRIKLSQRHEERNNRLVYCVSATHVERGVVLGWVVSPAYGGWNATTEDGVHSMWAHTYSDILKSIEEVTFDIVEEAK